MSEALTEPAKLLLLASPTALLTHDKIISNNGKAFLKEMILRRDTRIGMLLKKFEGQGQNSGDSSFLETLHELIMSEAQTLYNELFFDTSLEVGKTLSKAERDNKQLAQEKSLIYGEVEFSSFYRVLRKINPAPGLVFYDLGSGTGKAVFAARFAYDFSKCIGIEILSSLHAQAKTVLDRYNSEFKSHLALGQSQHAAVYEGSFLDYDWSDGEVVFANSTCFDDSLMVEMSKMAERLKPGAIVVTFTKGMTTDKFELLERKRYRMSWGPATVFIHRRLNADGSPVGPPSLNILPSDSITYDDEPQPGDAYNSARQDSDGSEDDGAEEEEEDLDYDDDIDMYIKHGFDMDPGNQEEDEDEDEEEGSEEQSEDEGSEGEEDSGEVSDNEDNDSADPDEDDDVDFEEEGSDGSEVELTPQHHQQQPATKSSPYSSPNKSSPIKTSPIKSSPYKPAYSPSARAAATEESIDAIMEKISERRKVVNALLAGGTSLTQDKEEVYHNNNSSFSPPRSSPKSSPKAHSHAHGGASGDAHSHATKHTTFSPATLAAPHHEGTATHSQTSPMRDKSVPLSSTPTGHHTITTEAPMSASRGGLTMLNPNLMRSPAAAYAQQGSSPSVQIHSPLDSALLMRKRASAQTKRVPLSAYQTTEEDFY